MRGFIARDSYTSHCVPGPDHNLVGAGEPLASEFENDDYLASKFYRRDNS